MAHMLIQQKTPAINLHQNSSMEEKDLSTSTPALENRLFFYPPSSERFLQFLEQFASETHLPKYQPTSNDFIKKNLPLPLTKSECDIKNPTSDPVVPIVVVDEVDEDPTAQINANVNTDRSTRRRKRRSSLTKTSSNDQIEPLIPDSTNINSTSPVIEDTQTIPIETLSIQDTNDENAIPTNPIRGRRK